MIDADSPVVIGLVVETQPGKAADVSRRLERIDGFEIVGGDDRRRLAAVWSGSDRKKLVDEAENIVRDDPDILGMYPTFVGQDDDAEA